MKDIEELAESIAKDAATACAANALRRAVERRGVNSLPRAEAVISLKELERTHMVRSVQALTARWPEIKEFMSMPPINPS